MAVKDSNSIITGSTGTYSDGAGNDTYIVGSGLLTGVQAQQTIQIVDGDGANRIFLENGLSIVSASFVGAADAAELVLSNGSKIQILGASTFSFLTGDLNSPSAPKTFAQMVLSVFGVAAPVGSETVTVANDGTPTVIGAPTASTFSITATSASAPEGNTGTTNLSVTVSRTGDTTKAASVTVATADGTATVGDSDYVAVSQVVSFDAGQTTKTVAIAINGDTKVEENESFTVGLSNASPGDSINTASVALTITNDDQPIVNQTFVLTANPDGFTGGDGDDQFIASDTTLSAADVLDGAAGNDTLRYASSAAAAVNESGFATSNIENIRVTSDATDGTTFDMTGVAGATMMANDNSSTNLSLTGVKNLMDLEVVNVSGGNTDVAYQAAVVAGSADTQKITVNNVASNAGLPVSSINVNGIETFAVTSTGSASQLNNLTGSSLNKVTVAGAADLTVVGPLAGVATVDASAFTGKLVTTVDATQSLAVKGGSGDDTISVSGNLSANDSLNGGAGIDTLSVSNAQANTGTNGAATSNFEQLGVTTAATGTINMDNFAGFSKVILDAGMGGNVAITNAVTGLAVEVDQNTTSGNNLTLTLKTDGTADTATILFDEVNNNGIPASPALPIPDAMGVVTANQVETLNLDATKLAAGTSQALSIASLNANAAKTLNIKSDAGLTLAATTTPNLTKVDASASTGSLNLNALGLATTGATVLGGAGSDTINAGTGADTLTGNAGNDTFTFEVGDSTAVATDTITDFVSGTDKFNLSNYGLTAASQFVGTFTNFGSAQGALIGGETPTPATYATMANNSVVFEANFDGAGNGRLWLDNGDGTLDANDNRIILKGVSNVTAADLGLAAGSAINLTAPAATVNATTNTNATAVTTAGPDTINTTVANLAGSTVNGAGGTDTLAISDAVTVALTPDDNAAGGNLTGVTQVTLAAGTSGVGNVTIANDITKLTAGAASTVTLGATNRNFQGSTGNDTINTLVANLIPTAAVPATATTPAIPAGAGATINGGAGTDTLVITDTPTANLVLNSTLLTNLENVTLAAGTGAFVVTTTNTAGLTTTAGAASNVILGNGGQTFVGSTGNDVVGSDASGTNNDTINTGAGADRIDVKLGDDKIDAGTGSDVVVMQTTLGAALTSGDTVIGGTAAGDFDVLNIGTHSSTGLANAAGSGNASGAGTDLNNVSGFEQLNIAANSTASVYNTVDSLVAAGQVLFVDMTESGAAVTFNGAAEKDGSFVLAGGAFNDVLTGGNQADRLIGGAGSDILSGGAGGNDGSDTFFVSASTAGIVSSTITAMDTIQRLDVSNGTKDLVDLVNGKNNLQFLTIANADTGALSAALNTAISQFNTANAAVAWNATDDVFLMTVQGGTAAGTYLLSNEDVAGTHANTFDAADVIVKIGQIDGVLTIADFF